MNAMQLRILRMGMELFYEAACVFQPSTVKVTSGLNEKIVDNKNYLIVLIDSKLCSPILVLTLYKGGSLFEILDTRDSRSLRFRFRRRSSGRIFSISSGVSDNDDSGDVVV